MTGEDLDLFKRLFVVAKHAYILGNAGGKPKVIVGKVSCDDFYTPGLLEQHFSGSIALGAYCSDSQHSNQAVVSIGSEDPKIVKTIHDIFEHEIGVTAHIEKRHRIGYYIRVLFADLHRDCYAARLSWFVRELFIRRHGERALIEVFPPRCPVSGNFPLLGSYTWLPLHGPRVRAGRTVFVDPDTLEPFPDQWEFLQNVVRNDKAAAERAHKITWPPWTIRKTHYVDGTPRERAAKTA